MAEQETPRKGDKVRVTYDAVVVDPDNGLVTLEVAEGWFDAPPSASFEVLERADDPSRDEIGTTATTGNRPWVKVDINRWVNPSYELSDRSDGWMTGRRVTGAVPGTPAAEAQRDRAESGEACDNYDPKGTKGDS
jgi:hypothetical protein